MFFAGTVFLLIETLDEVYAVSVLTSGRGPVFFPRILLGVMLFLSVAVTIQGFNQPSAPITRQQLLLVFAVVGLTGVYILSITAVGFLISTVVFVFALPWLLGYRNLLVIGAVTGLYPIAVWYVFEKIFKIILPSSPWFDAF